MIRLSLSTPCSAPLSPSPSDQSPAMEYVWPFQIESNNNQYLLFSLRQQARWLRGRVVQGQRGCREKRESAKDLILRSEGNLTVR